MKRLFRIAAALIVSATLMRPFGKRTGTGLASHPANQAGSFNPRITHLAGFAAIAAAIAAAVVCWTGKTLDSALPSTTAKTESGSVAPAPAAGPASGISPGELPYDGNPPTSHGKTAAAGASTPDRNAPPPGTALPKDQSHGQSHPAPAPSATPRLAQRNHRPGKHPVSHMAKRGGAKKRERGKPYAMRSRKAVPSLASVVHGKLAQCEKTGNFFKRERCKWKVCNGMWGKHGCPSYQNQAALP